MILIGDCITTLFLLWVRSNIIENNPHGDNVYIIISYQWKSFGQWFHTTNQRVLFV